MIEQLLHTAVEKALQFLYLAEGQSIQFQKHVKILMTLHWLSFHFCVLLKRT